MINFEPASVILSKSQPTPESDFYVTQVDDSSFSITATTSKNILAEGQLLKVSGVTALLTSLKGLNGTAKVVTGLLSNISVLDRGVVERFIVLQEPNFKIISSTTPVGVLSILCSIPSFHKAGRLGWSLYKDGSLLVIGNDFPTKGVISFNGPKRWLKGSYSLQVSLYEENSLSILRSKSKSIILNEDTQYIGIGNSHDLEPKLVLT